MKIFHWMFFLVIFNRGLENLEEWIGIIYKMIEWIHRIAIGK